MIDTIKSFILFQIPNFLCICVAVFCAYNALYYAGAILLFVLKILYHLLHIFYHLFYLCYLCIFVLVHVVSHGVGIVYYLISIPHLFKDEMDKVGNVTAEYFNKTAEYFNELLNID